MQDYTFPATVSARDMQRNYTKIFNRVKRTNKPIIIMANNTPQAAIVSLKSLESFTRQDQEKAFQALTTIRRQNENLNEDEVMEMVQKEVKAVRRQRYAQAQGCT
jgi:prevent-host-death family protein